MIHESVKSERTEKRKDVFFFPFFCPISAISSQELLIIKRVNYFSHENKKL